MEDKEIFFIKNIGYFGTYETFLLISLIILMLILIKSSYLSVKLNKEKKEPGATNMLMVSLGIFFLFSLIAFANILVYNGYSDTLKIINEQKYKVVEGRINNYKPVNHITDKKFESFDVNGINFVYSPAIRHHSFSLIKAEGNPLKEGDIVNIWYYNPSEMLDGNLILKLSLSQIN